MPLGGGELLIVLAIILLFFGAKRVPELGRSLGRSIREFRVGAGGEGAGDEAPRQLRGSGGEEAPSGDPAPREQEATKVPRSDGDP